jgi:hypothetical protein
MVEVAQYEDTAFQDTTASFIFQSTIETYEMRWYLERICPVEELSPTTITNNTQPSTNNVRQR